jgi:putative hydrolase of the HAD superfamily
LVEPVSSERSSIGDARYRSGVAGGKAIFWDFDYTLGFRGADVKDEHRHPWGDCLLEILDAEEPGHGATIDTIRSHFHKAFPWHRHDEPHQQLADGDAWWTNVHPMFCRAFEATGLPTDRARDLASRYRRHFTDAAAWSLYPDTLPALEELASIGWRHVVVSNHVPELEQIVGGLGLDAFVDRVVCSAVIGYEKPHPEVFRTAIRVADDPETAWMVGDNPIADVQGAESVGIPAIQVRMRRGEGVRRYSPDLTGVVEIVSSGTR